MKTSTSNKIIIFFNKNALLIFLFLVFSTTFGFFSNAYKIFVRSYDERIGRTFGYGCEKYSYGFVKNIQNNFIKNLQVNIINFSHVLPDSKSIFHELKKDKEKNNLILLNYNNQDLQQYNIDIKEYQLIHKEKECFFYKKVNND